MVYLYYIIKVQNPEKVKFFELLWISNDEYKLLN